MKTNFIGRHTELKQLAELKVKKTASLVVIMGRRRIGKSSLIQEFAKDFSSFWEFQGLAPRSGVNSQTQLQNFSEQIKDQVGVPAFTLNNWTEAFSQLSALSRQGTYLILLDEISWMAGKDPDFAGKLKIAWDTKFKHNPNLILVLCGSVSSWIEENILQDADFVGRISLTIHLGELSLKESNQFWEGVSGFGLQDKLQVLSVTGGVPKYLEEINPQKSALQNIGQLCFHKNGFFYSEFDKIFNELFNKRAVVYKNIIKSLIDQRLSNSEIAQDQRRAANREMSEYLHDLEISGFLKREYQWDFKGKLKKLSRFRIKDNYVRFYLRYVEPHRHQIEASIFTINSIDQLLNWDTIMGLQFENLILNNIDQILNLLEIDKQWVIYAGPFLQTHNARQVGCQVDLLIQTQHNQFFLCEIKNKKNVGIEIIKEIDQKISKIPFPKNASVRPVLISTSTIGSELKRTAFFNQIIHFSQLL